MDGARACKWAVGLLQVAHALRKHFEVDLSCLHALDADDRDPCELEEGRRQVDGQEGVAVDNRRRRDPGAPHEKGHLCVILILVCACVCGGVVGCLEQPSPNSDKPRACTWVLHIGILKSRKPVESPCSVPLGRTRMAGACRGLARSCLGGTWPQGAHGKHTWGERQTGQTQIRRRTRLKEDDWSFTSKCASDCKGQHAQPCTPHNGGKL